MQNKLRVQSVDLFTGINLHYNFHQVIINNELELLKYFSLIEFFSIEISFPKEILINHLFACGIIDVEFNEIVRWGINVPIFVELNILDKFIKYIVFLSYSSTYKLI